MMKIQVPSKLTVASTYGILLQRRVEDWPASENLNPVTLHGLLEIDPKGLPGLSEREFWDEVDKSASKILGVPVHTTQEDVYYHVEIKEPK
jgi:hypothetical protein